MEQLSTKHFRLLEEELSCECKTIDAPVDLSGTFHSHDGFELLLVLDGDMNLYVEGSGKKAERGELICIHPYVFHRAELLSIHTYDRIVINFKESLLQAISSSKSDLSSRFCPVPSNTLDIIPLNQEETRLFISYAASLQKALECNEFGDDLLARAYFTQIMVMLGRHTAAKALPSYPEIIPKLVTDTFTYIESHLAEEITIKVLEEEFHHNGSYISRCFKKVTGTPLQQYIIAKKITHAQQLLRMGYSPSDVCYMTGFNNYSNFSRTFSKMTGSSPKQYQITTR